MAGTVQCIGIRTAQVRPVELQEACPRQDRILHCFRVAIELTLERGMEDHSPVHRFTIILKLYSVKTIFIGPVVVPEYSQHTRRASIQVSREAASC